MTETVTLKDGGKRVDVSIVIPVYFNEGLLKSTMDGLKRVVIDANPERRFEVVFVDDGSGDGSYGELLEIRQAHPGLVRIIKLTRNFGQPSARMAGLNHARGRAVVSMSADGQDPPDLINTMIEHHFSGAAEIVVCARKGRDESWYRVVTSRVFYALMRWLSFPNMPSGGFDYVLLGRKALDAILRNQEANPFFQGQILWTGFPIEFLEYHRRKREVGKSRWTFGKKLTLLIDGVMSYSFLPIRLMSAAGLTVAMAGFFYAAYLIVKNLAWGTRVLGWTTLMVVILVTSGIHMLMLGIIGEYVWRTLAQARRRDPYIIEEVLDIQDGQD